jgi:hypothetical protein
VRSRAFGATYDDFLLTFRIPTGTWNLEEITLTMERLGIVTLIGAVEEEPLVLVSIDLLRENRRSSLNSGLQILDANELSFSLFPNIRVSDNYDDFIIARLLHASEGVWFELSVILTDRGN